MALLKLFRFSTCGMFDSSFVLGVQQLLAVFAKLQKQVTGILPSQHSELGNLCCHRWISDWFSIVPSARIYRATPALWIKSAA